jgi:glycerol-3-phosphate dehydrogenase
MPDLYDLAIIGGGINGCGIARDAAGRGLKVYLAEMGDLASGTSSWSTKLIHGGLRYLEHLELRLVREALQEREVLWRIAPHVVAPMRFVLPHHNGLRPRWMLRAGLFLYDHIGGRKRLPAARTLDLGADSAGAPLQRSRFTTGFEYSDCTVDDARLVVLNAVDARTRGARIETRVRMVSARRDGTTWTVQLADRAGASRGSISARALVNAAGPWVAGVLQNGLGLESRARVRLVQGSHIVTRRLFPHDRAYIFQHSDRRIVFAIPYEDDFTLIGTTDRDYRGDPAQARATESEIDYLCRAVSGYFARAVLAQDVVWSFSGVRPLYDDGASEAKAATRDYVFELDDDGGAAPVLSPYLGSRNPLGGRWTAGEPLPGGDFPVDGRGALVAEMLARHPFLDEALARRLVRAYGTRAMALLSDARDRGGLGRHFGAGLYEREVRHLMAFEWALTAEDVVWRRSKLGLRMSPAEIAALDAFMREAR